MGSKYYKLDRNREIYEARKEGAKLQELADKYGLSKERIRQIYYKYERLYDPLFKPRFTPWEEV